MDAVEIISGGTTVEGMDTTPINPFSVVCKSGCGRTFLSEQAYDAQIMEPDSPWKCPKCGGKAEWDDGHYEQNIEAWYDAREQE